MDLRKRIVLIGSAQLVALASVLFTGYYVEARRNVQQQFIEKARAIVLLAESTREEMGVKWTQGIFSAAQLSKWAAEGRKDLVLSAVPVVTAWKSAMLKAEEGGYQFKVPKFEPRNPQNTPDEVEARVLRLLEAGKTEHWEIDADANAIRYFRPVKLTSECLLCHGNPEQSRTLWANDKGLDPTGGVMEDWQVGEVHGAFEVIQSLDAADAAIAASLWRGAGLVLLVLAVCSVALAWLTTRIAVNPLRSIVSGLVNGSYEIRAASSQVATSAQSVADGSTRQAASLEETSASVEEMNAMTSQNAQNAQEAATLVAEVDERVGDSNHALEAMVQAMSAIEQSSGQVSKIIKTIDEIAFQTNLLALNAAVEAARAGEAGLGFAVVADEVRNLAQRSAGAARDTSQLIEQAAARAGEGQSRVSEVTQAIAEITRSVGQVKRLVDSVSQASVQQATGVTQVAQAIQEMEQVTQSTAAAAEESAAACEQMSAQAWTSMTFVRDLQAMVDGGAREEPGAMGASGAGHASDQDARYPRAA